MGALLIKFKKVKNDLDLELVKTWLGLSIKGLLWLSRLIPLSQREKSL